MQQPTAIHPLNFIGLITANTVLGSAMPMLIILGGLAGLMLAPTTALATLPASLQTLAGLFAAAPFSLLMGRLGRRSGFAIGALCATGGSVLAVWALMNGSFWALCVAHLAFGAAIASYQFFRFAAAEVVTASWQPVAISLMLTSGLIAAFAGPQLFIVTRDSLAPVPLAGAYAAIGVLSLVGVIPLLIVRVPPPVVTPPQTIAERLAGLVILRRPAVRNAVVLGAVSQGVMVFLMVPTPLAMIGCGLSDVMAGDVIRWHVVAMFAPSFVTGFIIRKFGAQRVALTGLMLLAIAAAAAMAGLMPIHFYLSLILLGVGWNFGFIGATTLLTAAVADTEKPMVQGVNDTVIALVSTLCAFAAGALVAGLGWTILAAVALGLVLAGAIASVRTSEHTVG
ncbi:MFS transporter [Sulfitobacter sp. S190]|uniref:MFS transporter n=1 Tax=Sulfitobacter sp. S190 TaxID=2867022 RepID=UPI0021A33FDD|nr:MFS transporter [Sulfitobacter sp. S190]UWR20913.1 MFS transporter [Sulfitobacter sp. S190]